MNPTSTVVCRYATTLQANARRGATHEGRRIFQAPSWWRLGLPLLARRSSLARSGLLLVRDASLPKRSFFRSPYSMSAAPTAMMSHWTGLSGTVQPPGSRVQHRGRA